MKSLKKRKSGFFVYYKQFELSIQCSNDFSFLENVNDFVVENLTTLIFLCFDELKLFLKLHLT